VNFSGLPLGAGYLATYSNLSPNTIKLVYQNNDPTNLMPWGYAPIPNSPGLQGIRIDANGTQGPFYFEYDTANPLDTYNLTSYDVNGVEQWNIPDFVPPDGGGGGGGGGTSYVNLQNFVTNGQLWRNVGLLDITNASIPITPSTYTVIAPGCHAGLALTQTAIPAQNAGPDIVFLKNNTSATDTITFPLFPQGQQPLISTGGTDVAPFQYMEVACTAAGSAENQKCLQIPITAKVQNLTNLAVTFSIWAKGNSGTKTLTCNFRQFFGDGGGSADVITPISGTINLTSSWAQYSFSVSVPDITVKTLGTCGNDALFIQIQYPFDLTFNIDITKPALYLGNNAPSVDYQTYDQIDGVLNVPRTGDVRPSYGFIPPGWLVMNDGSIGNATSNGTTRANIDTFPLFNFIWNLAATSYIPIYNSSNVVTTRGANAIVDFNASKSIALPAMLGRALSEFGQPSGISGTNYPVGAYFGNQTDTLLANNLPANFGTGIALSTTNVTGLLSGGAINISGVGGANTAASTITNSGGSQPFNIIQPTAYTQMMIKL
jgi:hypothetical protein